MVRALKVCSRPGCPNLTDKGRCDDCRKTADKARGTATERGYDEAHRRRFRAGVLRKHPLCQCDQADQHGHGQRCYRASEHADHWPLSRRELVERGLDPNDPERGRGLCHRCHSGETAAHQPGGWHAG